MLTARLEPPHPVDGWRVVLAGVRPSDRLMLQMPWAGDLEYFRLCHAFFRDLGIPTRHVWVLANTVEEVDGARAAGLRAAWVHHNCWLDDTMVKPMPAPKVYGAVMVCQPAGYKRPWLAAEVKDLAIVEGRSTGGERVDMQRIPHVRYFLDVAPVMIPRIVSRAEVGLILSEIEGGCYASSEYLMCGVPVVSTPSRGGRDVFYDADNALIVEPTPPAVAEGVRRLRARRLDPAGISARHRALNLAFRARFVKEVLAVVLAEMGVTMDATAVLGRSYRHKMMDWWPRDGAARLVRGEAV